MLRNIVLGLDVAVGRQNVDKFFAEQLWTILKRHETYDTNLEMLEPELYVGDTEKS